MHGKNDLLLHSKLSVLILKYKELPQKQEKNRQLKRTNGQKIRVRDLQKDKQG